MLIDRLKRITRDGRWIPEVDALRFIAICSVLLFHMLGEVQLRSGRIIPIEPNWLWLEGLLSNGDRGVGLFFVVSGMILAMPFARHFLLKAKPVSLQKYYMRRVTRLEPPYLAALIVATLLEVVYQRGFPPGFVPHFAATALYQHNLVFGAQSMINPIAWSLEVEVQFYLLAPLVMQVFRIGSKWMRRGLLLASVLLMGLVQVTFQGSPRVEMSILFFGQYFLMGLLVADVFVLNLETMKRSWLWDVAAIASMAVMFVPKRGLYWPHAATPFVAGVLCVAAMRCVALRWFFANKWVAVTGGMCYSIYLLHFIFIAVLFKFARRAILANAPFFVNYAIQLLLVAVPVVLLCVVFFLLVERPCMDPDWPSKLWVKLTGRRPEEVAVLDS
jgi:peptidoglycan/LPS O-acetylase OafA/YrhL